MRMTNNNNNNNNARSLPTIIEEKSLSASKSENNNNASCPSYTTTKIISSSVRQRKTATTRKTESVSSSLLSSSTTKILPNQECTNNTYNENKSNKKRNDTKKKDAKNNGKNSKKLDPSFRTKEHGSSSTSSTMSTSATSGSSMKSYHSKSYSLENNGYLFMGTTGMCMVHPRTLQASFILVATIIVAVVLNKNDIVTTDIKQLQNSSSSLFLNSNSNSNSCSNSNSSSSRKNSIEDTTTKNDEQEAGYNHHHYQNQLSENDTSTIQSQIIPKLAGLKFVEFMNEICQQMYCHDLLIPDSFRRTHVVLHHHDTKDTTNRTTNERIHSRTRISSNSNTVPATKIHSGEKIVEIPRHFTIWDSDVFLYDPWIYMELIERTTSTGSNGTITSINSSSSSAETNYGDDDVSPAAYLAVFLARQFQQQQRGEVDVLRNSSTSAGSSSSSTTLSLLPLDSILQRYIGHILPTSDDYYCILYDGKTPTSPIIDRRRTDDDDDYDVVPCHHHHHPGLWTESETKELLGGTYMSTYHHIRSVQKMIQKEYNIFALRSPKQFAIKISFRSYSTARLNVLTRSFGTGPISEPSPSSKKSLPTIMKQQQLFQRQKELLMKQFPTTAVQFFITQEKRIKQVGSYVMVPVLDQYNHHGNPNVEFRYEGTNVYHNSGATRTGDSTKEKEGTKRRDSSQLLSSLFVVRALRTIEQSEEIFDTYGKRTDSDLFARYGFTSLDGSDYTEANLALHHGEYIEYLRGTSTSAMKNEVTIQNENDKDPKKLLNNRSNKQLQQQITRYLQYDDGYENCIGPDDSSWKLKQIKFEYLLHRAHLFKHWVAVFSPRNKDAKPTTSSSSSFVNRQVETSNTNTSISKSSSSSNISMNKNKKQPPIFPSSKRDIRIDVNYVFATCRVITLTEYDYNGHAINVLENNLYNTSFLMPQEQKQHQQTVSGGEDVQDYTQSSSSSSSRDTSVSSLEYRTLLCIARMAQTAIRRFPYEIQQQYDDVRKMCMDDVDSCSSCSTTSNINLTLSYLRLGELQSYIELKNIAFAQIRRNPYYVEQMNIAKPSSTITGIRNTKPTDPRYTMRDQPCPFERYTKPLFVS